MRKRLQPHLMVGEGDIESICILSGDPERVPVIASYLKDSIEIAKHRGLITYRGYTKKGIAITVTTTGMGGPSCAIVLEELRRVGARVFLRVGSCGGLPLTVNIGDIVVPYGAIRDEATSLTYAAQTYPAVVSPEVFHNLTKICQQQAVRYHTGLVWTTDVYYRFSDPDRFKHWADRQVLAVEMETSIIFTFAQVYGLAAGAILACDGNLHIDPKGELETENTAMGEQHPALKASIAKEIEIAIAAIDNLQIDTV